MDAARSTVLVADDEPDLRRLVVRRLVRAGYEVVEAEDGEAAWARIEADGPAVAVLDIRMPRLDGLALTRRIRGGEHTNEMGIVLLTASAQEHEAQVGFDAGADRYLHKPFDADELLEAVATLAARGRGRT